MGECLLFGSFFLITEVAKIIWLLLALVKMCINLTQKLGGLNSGRFFFTNSSSGHPDVNKKNVRVFFRKSMFN
jgi:hypothetical protein